MHDASFDRLAAELEFEFKQKGLTVERSPGKFTVKKSEGGAAHDIAVWTLKEVTASWDIVSETWVVMQRDEGGINGLYTPPESYLQESELGRLRTFVEAAELVKKCFPFAN